MSPGGPVATGGALGAAAVAVAAWALRRRLRVRVARESHEIRGPLTAARLGLEPALRGGGVGTARAAAVDLQLERAGAATAELDRLARGWSGRSWAVGWQSGRRELPDEPVVADAVDIDALLTASVEALRGLAEAHGVELGLRASAGGGAVLTGSRPRLAQAIGNLIANAIEHGGETVDVRRRVTGDRVWIEVDDRGPGLPATIDELIRRSGRAAGQHGHGLSVASEVAAAHGGRLHAAPAHRGARLVLELPLARRSRLAA